VNLFKIVYEFKCEEDRGNALYSKELNTLLFVLYKIDKVIDCKSLKLDKFSSNPSIEDIENIVTTFIEDRYGKDYTIIETEEWKKYKVTTF